MSTHPSSSSSTKCHKNPIWGSRFTNGQLTKFLVFTTFRCESAETDLLMHSTLVLIHILHLRVHQYKILGGGGACDKYVESNRP
jgi:hypothetical protein